ncbi:hypothetical protein GH733_013358, partial [Mirounga leonina]
MIQEIYVTISDKNFQFSLKKLRISSISDIKETSLAANTFTITSHAETQPLTKMPPGFLDQLGIEKLKDTGWKSTTCYWGE